jgi:hypothetical protein
MTTFPKSPRLLKGAIVGFDIFNPLASVIVFQYNPHTLTRTLKANTKGGAKGEALRLTGPPKETIKMDIEIDATDQLEKGGRIAARMGIYPQLSALEMLLYPKSSLVIANMAMGKLGTMEVNPPEAPLTLLVWGVKRVLPVRLEGLTITEEAYDTNLNPIQAKVSLDLQVLSYSDFQNKEGKVTHPGFYLSLAHQVVKEAMAVIGSVSDLGAVAGGNVKLL